MVEIIAEIGINHNGNMNLAHEMIRQAAMCGADVAKFQMYSVEALFGPDGKDPNEEIFNGVKHTELTKDDVVKLMRYCDECKIEFMASVFDEERFNFLEEVGVKRHKIASRTAKLTPELADKIVASGKACLISLGMGAEPRWGDKKTKPSNVKYLYCVSEYPTEYSSLDIPKDFNAHPIYTGFSDHSLGLGSSFMAISAGAKIVEKHFTLNKAADGFDHIASIGPSELADLVKYGKEISKVVDLSKSNH